MALALAALLAAGPALAQDAAPDAAPDADAGAAPEPATDPEDAPATEADAEAAPTPAPDGDLANLSAFGDWVVTCEAASVRRNVCRLVQEQTLRETGELVARFIAAPVPDGAILLAQTPMGTYLPGGAVYRFAGDEEAPQREMIWQRCLGDVCEAAAPLDASELAQFDTYDSILFGFRMDAEAEPVILNVDISRFGEALAALRAADPEMGAAPEQTGSD